MIIIKIIRIYIVCIYTCVYIYILDARVSVFTRTHNCFYEQKASERNKHESEISSPYCTTSAMNCLLYIGYFSEKLRLEVTPPTSRSPCLELQMGVACRSIQYGKILKTCVIQKYSRKNIHCIIIVRRICVCMCIYL